MSATPCPYCGRQPLVAVCEPWPRNVGAAPWYAGCYLGGSREHFVGGNGTTRAEALATWEAEVAKARDALASPKV